MVTPVQDGDQVITLLDVTQPRCALVYGEAPCAAVLGETGQHKCYNTRATCQDPENYTPTQSVTTRYRFDQSIPDIYGRCIPSLRSAEITPGQINIGAMDRNVSPFGRRNVADLTFEDHPSLDIEQDPYFEERLSGAAQADGIGYNPEERGQYWAKWLARNPFYNGYEAVIYRGAVGQPVEEMQQFRYVIDQITGPDDNGGVSMTLKDLFSRVTERKAKLPKASRGELVSDLPDTETGSFEVSVSPITGSDLDAEYPDSGEFRVAIGSEVIRVTRSGGTFSIVARADIGTQIDSHDADDTVQLVYAQEALRATQIVRNMLVEGTTVTDDQIPLADWNAEADEFFPNLYTGYIVKPTAVDQMTGELAEQAGFSIWPEIETGQIRVRALSAKGAASAELLESRDILDDGIDKKRRQDSRVSQVWVYFGLIDPTEDLDDNTNYRTRLIRGDLAAEDDAQYGTQAIREVYSRWIPQFGRGAAETVGDRILSLFRDPPLSASFNLSVTRALPFELAQRFNLTLDREQDFTGLARQLAMVPIQIMRNEDRLMIASQELRFFTPPDQARNIFIDNDTLSFNLRDAHDALFGPAVAGDEVACFVNAVVGSESPGIPAFIVGDWPSGVVINLIISDAGVIAGCGGSGGKGGDAASQNAQNGSPGQDGSTAIFTRQNVSIENLSIIGGGAGGAGGGGGAYVRTGGTVVYVSGGGGGGAAGRLLGTGGRAGSIDAGIPENTKDEGEDGLNGDLDIGGNGGSGGSLSRSQQVGPGGGTTESANATAGSGGKGGDLGQDGEKGGNATGSGTSEQILRSGGAGGSAGPAIDGESFITFIAEGTILGARIN